MKNEKSKHITNLRWIVGLSAADLWGYRQAVRHRTLTPASPVRIWLAQFGKHLASHACDLALAESPLAARMILLREERDRPAVFIEHHLTMLDCQ